MLNNLIDSSDLEYPEMLHPNSQRQCNSMPNFRDDNNLSVGQKEYRKERGVKSSKAQERRQDSRVE